MCITLTLMDKLKWKIIIKKEGKKMKRNWLIMIVASIFSLTFITGCGTMNNDNDPVKDEVPGEAPLNPQGKDNNPNSDQNNPGDDLQREDNTDLNDNGNEQNNNNDINDDMNDRSNSNNKNNTP